MTNRKYPHTLYHYIINITVSGNGSVCRMMEASDSNPAPNITGISYNETTGQCLSIFTTMFGSLMLKGFGKHTSADFGSGRMVRVKIIYITT